MVKQILSLLSCFAILFFSFTKQVRSQCNNAGLESGNFTGWTGTWGDGVCTQSLLGICITTAPDPFQNSGLNQGTLNQAANATPERSHTIMSSGFDPIVGGTTLPVVFPGGGSYSMRLGNAQAEDGGESISYSFNVTSSNCNFTYHYAVVLNDGGHPAGEQPYFQIRMYDGSNNLINCATYDVDGTTAPTIGGFLTAPGGELYKPWSSVFIPLNNYIGQNVRIEFVTRDCDANGGSHFAYAYLDATCSPLEIISSSPTVCGGQDVTLTAPAGAATYSWTGPGVTPPGNTQQATITLAGAYTVTMTTFGTVPCTFTLDTIIPGSPGNPVANFTATSACAGDPIQFSDASTPAGSITQWWWDFNGDNTPDATTQNPAFAFGSTGTYPVRLLISWPPCLDDTIINVTVISNPTSTFTTTSPVCAGIPSTITYTGSAPPNATYTWDFDGGNVVSGSGQGPYQISWLTGGTKDITLTVTVGSCSSPVSTEQVVVNPFPTINLTPDLDICEGESTTLTASGATTYSWLPATGLSSTSGASVTATPATTTNYTVTGTANGCNGTAAVTVTVNPYPTVTVTPLTTTVCAGVTTTLTAAGASAYTWSPATGLSATTGTSVDATPLVTTTYTVTGDNNGCTASATADINIDPTPTLVLSPDVTICEGQTTTLTAGGTGANSYDWSPATGLSAITGASVDANPSSTITYTITAVGNVCNATGTIVVTVNPYPVINVSPASATICEGETQTFTASGAVAFTWSPGTGLSSTTDAVVDASPLTTITYEVIGSDAGCNDTIDVTLTVNPIPVTTVSPDVTICSGTSTPLVAGGATTYVWSPTTGLSSGTNPNVTANPGTTTTYTVTGTSNNCSSSADVTVTVNPTPTVGILPLTYSYCEGGSVDLEAYGADTYVWSPATGLSATTGTNVTANPIVTTTYTITGTSLGCIDDETITVTVYPNPVVDFSASDTIGCQPLCVDFTNNSTISSGNIASYFWTLGDGTTSSATSLSHCYNDTGIYTVELTATSDNNCVTKLTKQGYITVNPLPVANFNFTPETASILDPTIQFADQSNGATEWYWYFGDGDSINNLITTPEHVYPTTQHGTYTARLLIVNQFGCTDEITHDVVITPVVTLYIPNAFSPNSNRINDDFYAYGEGIVEFEMAIFNRWGEYIFRSQDMNIGWDGTYNGIEVPNDVYVYVVNYVGIDDSNGTKRGMVTVVK
ncbi:MAG: PKD domain-containing protein [Bacteroidia bacterium]